MSHESNEDFLEEIKEYANKEHSKEEILRLLYKTSIYTKKGKLKKQFRDETKDDFKEFMRSFCRIKKEKK